MYKRNRIQIHMHGCWLKQLLSPNLNTISLVCIRKGVHLCFVVSSRVLEHMHVDSQQIIASGYSKILATYAGHWAYLKLSTKAVIFLRCIICESPNTTVW